MAVSFDSLATTKQAILGFFRGKLGDWDLSDKGFFGKLAAVSVLTLYQFIRTARQIDLDAVPTSQTSSDGIAEWAANGVGLPNGAGGFGLKGAVAATGGVALLTGTNVTYPALQSFTASDGQTKFQLTNGPLTIVGTGSVSGNVNATTTGIAGNLSAAAVLTVDSPPMGADLTATLTTGLSGGLDAESKDQALARIQDRIRNPPKAITAADLRLLAEGVSGIDRAYVYPNRLGTGTADVVVTQAGTGQSRRASAGEITAAQAVLTTDRNVTAVVTAKAPYMPNGVGHAIRARVVPTTGNEFDWDSGSAGFTVAAYNAGTKALTLNANAANLDTAVNTNLQQPRIQIGNTNAPDLPQIAIVTAYNPGTFVATLSVALPSSPNVSDPVHAGGSAVLPIAQAIHDLVAGLGPSKVSGYLDSTDTWDDTIRVAEITRVALDAVDGTGKKFAYDLVASTQPTIDGASLNVQGADNGTNPPEIPYAKSIVVTP